MYGNCCAHCGSPESGFHCFPNEGIPTGPLQQGHNTGRIVKINPNSHGGPQIAKDKS